MGSSEGRVMHSSQEIMGVGGGEERKTMAEQFLSKKSWNSRKEGQFKVSGSSAKGPFQNHIGRRAGAAAAILVRESVFSNSNVLRLKIILLLPRWTCYIFQKQNIG